VRSSGITRLSLTLNQTLDFRRDSEGRNDGPTVSQNGVDGHRPGDEDDQASVKGGFLFGVHRFPDT
jgi:hypothetical protein